MSQDGRTTMVKSLLGVDSPTALPHTQVVEQLMHVVHMLLQRARVSKGCAA